MTLFRPDSSLCCRVKDNADSPALRPWLWRQQAGGIMQQRLLCNASCVCVSNVIFSPQRERERREKEMPVEAKLVSLVVVTLSLSLSGCDPLCGASIWPLRPHWVTVLLLCPCRPSVAPPASARPHSCQWRESVSTLRWPVALEAVSCH